MSSRRSLSLESIARCIVAHRDKKGGGQRDRAARYGLIDYSTKTGSVPHAAGQEPFELPRPHRVLEFPDRLGLDLAHTFAGDLEDPTDLFERVRIPVADAVAEF